MELKKMNKFLVMSTVFCMLLGTPGYANVELDDIGMKFSKALGYTSIDFVEPNSMAELNGLKALDRIRRISNKNLAKLSDYDMQHLLDEDENFYLLTTADKNDVFIYRRNLLADKQVNDEEYLVYSNGYIYKNPLFNFRFDTKIVNNMLKIPDEIKNFSQKNYNENAVILDKYKKFYSINYDTLEIKYLGFTTEEFEKLNKKDKAYYEKIQKIQKYIDKKEYLMALTLDSNYIPVYLYMYNHALKNNRYGNALYALEKLNQLNEETMIFNCDIINYHLGILYYILGNHELGLEYLRPYLSYADKTQNQIISLIMAHEHLNKKNYSSAIFYFNQIKKESTYYKYSLVSILECYKELKNTNKVREYLILLCDVTPTYNYYMQLADLSRTKSEKFSYYKKARACASSARSNDAFTVNEFILKDEQAKINNAVKGFTSFYSAPNWKNYEDNFHSYYTMSAAFSYQDDFYKSTNACISKYKGSNLKSCFAEITKKYDAIIEKEEKRYYSNLEYRRQKELQNDLIREQKDMINDLTREINSLKYQRY